MQPSAATGQGIGVAGQASQRALNTGYDAGQFQNQFQAPGQYNPNQFNAERVSTQSFAQPGKAPQLMDRIGREQRMFETANAALGGSKTADNIADAADVGGFDPSMIGAFASGGIKGAPLQALTRAVQGVQGRNSQTRDIITRALMTNSPQQAKTLLDSAVKKGQLNSAVRNTVVRALTSGSTIGTTMAQ